MAIKLSICIPTYNFGKFIGETLESIIPQLNEKTEIVILDGGSTDNTKEVVQHYQKLNSNIHYFQQPEKGGIDKDMHLSVEYARGDYCWLFSSDDIMQKNAIKHLLSEIEEGHDVYLCNFTICDFDVKITMEEHFILKDRTPKVYNLSDTSVRKSYFGSAIATPAFFSFMSSLVIKRSRWMENSHHEPNFFGSCWAHAARIFRMIPKGLVVKHLPNSFLRKRSFNDSFMDRGFIHRIGIAIDGYHHIGNVIFGDQSDEAFHIRRTLRNEFPLRTFISAKEHIKTTQDRDNLWRLYEKTYIDSPQKTKLPFKLLIFLPNPVISFLRLIYHAKKRFTHRLRSSYLQKERLHKAHGD